MGVVTIPPNPIGPGTLTCTIEMNKAEAQQVVAKLKDLVSRLAMQRRSALAAAAASSRKTSSVGEAATGEAIAGER